MAQQRIEKLALPNVSRELQPASFGDQELGPLALLPGVWANLRDPYTPSSGPFNGHGWNMIALPVASEKSKVNFRLLMNQYNERLVITTKDSKVPNRGIRPNPPEPQPAIETDQAIAALDYEQGIVQIATADFPSSGLTQPINSAIHHEPGLFLFMKNQVGNGPNIGRLGTIPHGNSVLALGTATSPAPGQPVIPPSDGLPIGVGDANRSTSPYFEPYAHFINTPFLKRFRPDRTHELLLKTLISLGQISRTLTLHFSTSIESGGIVNIPFIRDQAAATEMDATFWIMETQDPKGHMRHIMMYHQVVMLEFFKRRDDIPGLIKWPHVSINTMERIGDAPASLSLSTEDISARA